MHRHLDPDSHCIDTDLYSVCCPATYCALILWREQGLFSMRHFYTQAVSWYPRCGFQRPRPQNATDAYRCTKSCRCIYSWLCPSLVATCCPLFRTVKRCNLPPFVMPLLWNPTFEKERGDWKSSKVSKVSWAKTANTGFMLNRIFHIFPPQVKAISGCGVSQPWLLAVCALDIRLSLTWKQYGWKRLFPNIREQM